MNLEKVTAVLLLAVLSGTANAQPRAGSIRGIVSDARGAALAHAPLRASSAATPADARTYTASDGRYEVGGLAPGGAYTISVAMPGCAFAPFTRSDVIVAAGKALELDIRLDDSGNLIALADPTIRSTPSSIASRSWSSAERSRRSSGRIRMSGSLSRSATSRATRKRGASRWVVRTR
jgi:hypothetical protein